MTLWQNIGFRTIQRKFQYASEEESLERMHRENPCSRWGFKISDDPGQSVHSDGCSEVDENCGVWKAICFSAGRCTESFDSKFTLRQRRWFWSKKFWSSNNPDWNPLDYVWSVVERITNKSRHPNVTSLRIAIETAFVDMDSATLQHANASEKIEAIIQANGRYIE